MDGQKEKKYRIGGEEKRYAHGTITVYLGKVKDYLKQTRDWDCFTKEDGLLKWFNTPLCAEVEAYVTLKNNRRRSGSQQEGSSNWKSPDVNYSSRVVLLRGLLILLK